MQDGWTGLHAAAFKGRVEALQLLLSSQAFIDIQDKVVLADCSDRAYSGIGTLQMVTDTLFEVCRLMSADSCNISW